MAIFDLIQKLNEQNQQIADAVRAKDEKKAREIAQKNENPLVALSGLLWDANLPFSFSTSKNAEIMAVKSGSNPYSAAEMSDGERNALLLAAEVLTVPSETLILIDEPELHVHRSIISPLLSGLFAKRPDCVFVVSTHEVMLPLDNRMSKILLLRSCTYENGAVVSWEADLVDSALEIDEDLKKDILGARKAVIFVEGAQGSLDMPLYSLIFPNTSVIPKGSCREAEHAATSIRSSTQLHWLKAFAIVDNDGRATTDVEKLNQCGVYPIQAYSVESIYYDLRILEQVAKKWQKLTGVDHQTLMEEAKAKGIQAIKEAKEHLSRRSAERKLRNEFLKHLPNKKTSFDKPLEVFIDTQGVLANELQILNDLIDHGDLTAIIRSYPIRESKFRATITASIGFKSRNDYEKAVMQLLKEDSKMLEYVKGLLGGLPEAVIALQ